MIGIVLAGGYGKRLLPLTKYKRKPFIELLGKTLLDYTVDYFLEAGIGNIIVVGRKGDHSQYKRKGVKLVHQEGLGEDDALKAAYDLIKGNQESGPYVIGFTGFVASPKNMVRMSLQHHSESSYPNTIVITPIVSGLETYGAVHLEGDRVTRFQKETSKSGYVFAGTLVLNYRGLETLVNEGFVQGINILAKTGKLGGYVWSGEWVEIGYPWDLLEAGALLLNSELNNMVSIGRGSVVSNTSIIKGPVYIGENVYIDENVYIQGPAYIGDNSFIGFASYIRPYTIIERNTIIGSRNEVKRSIVMKHTRTGTGVITADTIIGENSDVGEYTIFRSSFIKELPPRIRDKVFYRHKKPKLGSIIEPKCRIDPLTLVSPGEIMECENRD
ncbi:MAG: NDP-sugar synthase [Desulfurococcales archaeon]|nr:NDP-sugar synthase [Desulfurococcales archaeon]